MVSFDRFQTAQAFQVSVAALGILFVKLCYSVYIRRKYWPPGPPGLPFLGNVFQLTQYPWLRFTKWGETYGPIFSLNLAGQPAIVINSRQAAVDLLNRRAEIYSDRPRLIVPGEYLTGGIFIAFLSYGKQWLRLRRAAQEFLNIRFSKTYQPLQEHAAARLLSELFYEPREDLYHHLLRSTTSTVLSSIYGFSENESEDNNVIAQFHDMTHHITKSALPGAYLVEFFPVLDFLPLWMAKWKRDALQWHMQTTKMLEGFLGNVRQRMSNGTCKPCFCSLILESKEKHSLTNKEAAWLAGGLLGAGAETTAASLSVFVLAMCLYPDVMHKAQAQIDRVVGHDRLPSFADFDSLHYIRAIVKEVLRWRPVGPIALPRSVNKNDWYNGYFIPKEFQPECFLDESETVDVAPPDTLSLGHVSYGFGKRICVGMNLANQALFIDIACLLWAFDFEKIRDEKGQVIVPSRTKMIDSGVVARPAPFECSITVRSSDVAVVLGKGDITSE